MILLPVTAGPTHCAPVMTRLMVELVMIQRFPAKSAHTSLANTAGTLIQAPTGLIRSSTFKIQ